MVQPLWKSLAAAAKSLQSCPTLSDPMDGSPPGSSIHGIFQARVLEWGALPFPMPRLDNGETMEKVTDIILWGSKITADGDCSHEIKRRLLLGMEKAMAHHSSTLAWKIPWTAEPGRLQSMALLRVGHD